MGVRIVKQQQIFILFLVPDEFAICSQIKIERATYPKNSQPIGRILCELIII